MQAQRRSFHTSPANQRSCLACPTQSRHSVYQRTVRFAIRRGQASRRTYTSAMAGWPLLGLGRYYSRHVGTFYVAVSAQVTGSAAQAADERNVSKYVGLPASHLFVPIAIETLGSINEDGHSFLIELGRRLSTISDDPRESFLLFFSASSFSYKGLMRSHSEALLT